MGSLEVIILCCCFFFFLFFPAMITSIEDNCSPKACHKSEPEIHFPFRLEGLQLSQCGYPGFNLACNNMSKTVLQLPSSGMFFVRNIDYLLQEIQIYDVDNCLPRWVLYLNLSGSPFKTVYKHNSTFFNCSSSVDLSNSSLIPVGCLGSSTHKVWASNNTSSTVPKHRITGCEFVANVQVPIPLPGDSLGLENDLYLTWTNPYCGFCEAIDGKCGFNNTSHEIICYTDQRRHGPSGAEIVTWAAIIIFALPALVGLICCIAFCIKICCFHDGGHLPSIADLSRVILPQPVILGNGLDDSTIDSYPKIVLGESRRLPKPDDSTCPICLSEYLPKETLKIIPECNHGFHADCIDEWLRMNMTCPVCRNSPNQQPHVHAT